jgi:acyl-coenzyme A synthetase/AMP-(fatty) acid ligase
MSNQITQEEFNQIQGRLNSTTPGPWTVGGDDPTAPGSKYVGTVTDPDDPTEPGVLLGSFTATDAEFVAHAPTDMKALMDIIQDQSNQLAAYRMMFSAQEPLPPRRRAGF